ncbi:hypothetical protein C0Q70_15563 [Pomacea canaliculata]|uniref:DNA 3'-5' helicase n=1 Tax=Pomacea canaliculata TaxID=400727 RepID=A0A2T7NV77_POMCA|nr:hypothetical protein C0Q70_15563 [Pomacea canaliculata]
MDDTFTQSYEHVQKKRRIHRGLEECVAYSQSEEGTETLRQPLAASAKKQLPSRNLYPVHRRHKKFQTQVNLSLSAPSKIQIPGQILPCTLNDRTTEKANQLLQRLTGNMQMKTEDVDFEDRDSFSSGSELNEPSKGKFTKSSDNDKHILKNLGGFTTASSVYSQPSTHWTSCLASSSSATPTNLKFLDSSASGAQFTNFAPCTKKSKIPPGQRSIKQFMTPVSQSSDGVHKSNLSKVSSHTNSVQFTSPSQNQTLPGTSKELTCRMSTETCSSVKSESDIVYIISSDDSTDGLDKKKNDKMLKFSRQQSSDRDSTDVAEKLSCETRKRKRSRKTKTRKWIKESRTPGCRKTQEKSNSKTSFTGSCTSYSARQLQEQFVTVTPSTSRDFLVTDEDDFESCPTPNKPVMKSTVEVGKTYGLLGESKVEVEAVNYFQQLPLDVVENIFCRLPMLDLLLNTNRVCLYWNDVISNSKFIYWKKLYHRLKKDVTEARNTIENLLKQNDMCLPSVRLVSLIRYMKIFKPLCKENNLCELLQQHPKYTSAVILLKERAPDCFHNKEPNPWSLITALAMVATSVRETTLVLQLLTSPRANVQCTDIIECFYCIATFLLAFQKCSSHNCAARVDTEQGITCIQMSKLKNWSALSAMHYHLFYALYLFENLSISNHSMLQSAMNSSSGQQSIIRYSQGETKVRLTHEQVRIIRFTPGPGDIVKIIAFAGTGKTTTLVRYSQMRPNLRFLLIVFNKSVCEHAQKCFPANVTCKTAHSLAYAAVGKRYQAAKKLNIGSLKVFYVAMSLPEQTEKSQKENYFVRGKMVLKTINNFCASSDEEISVYHTPETQMCETTGLFEPIPFHVRQQYARDAEYYWNRMKDLQDTRVRMTHDGYMKLYQLSKPKLSGYDVILVDEAQDLTPALIDILHCQHQPKIFVGDPHQQIYSFRGAVNAMQQSFRFGPEISRMAGIILETMKAEKKTIVGHGKPGSVNGERVGQLAILCRTNYTVFSEAVLLCFYSSGLEGLDFLTLKDIYNLLHQPEGQRDIKSKFIARFENMAKLEKYAQKTTDNELLGKIRIVKTYDQILPACMSRIREKTVRDLTQADVVLSTVHKAKGLEFSTVKITDDFIESRADVEWTSIPSLRLPIEEVNLLYVAVTRAKHALMMSNLLYILFTYGGGGFAWPMLSDELTKLGISFTCLETGEGFEPKTLTLYRPKTTLGNKTERAEGVYSPQWLLDNESEFVHLLGCKI